MFEQLCVAWTHRVQGIACASGVSTFFFQFQTQLEFLGANLGTCLSCFRMVFRVRQVYGHDDPLPAVS